MYRPSFLEWGILLSAVAGACSPGPPDQILYNAKVVTLNADLDLAEALAISDGVLLAVGTSEEIRSLAGPQTVEHDMAGRTVIPGLGDNHYHGIGGGPGVDLSAARSMDDVLAAIMERATSLPGGGLVVTNSNWHEGQLAEQYS